MATRQYFSDTRTINTAYDTALPDIKKYKDMITAVGTVSSTIGNASPTIGSAAVQYERLVWSTPTTFGWFSERFATETVLSGVVTFQVYASTTVVAPDTARLRVKLSKVTTGGSFVETPLVQADSPTNLTSTVTAYTMSATMPQAVTIAANERVVARVYGILTSGTTWGTAKIDFRYGGPAGTGDSYIDFPGTITFTANVVRLSLRRTATNGIGNFFDLLPTFGTLAFASAIVNTVAGGNDIVWTRTAGGITAEWLSPRFKEQWAFPDITVQVWASESATTANASIRWRVFLRRPDGTEFLLKQETPAGPIELTTTVAVYVGANTPEVNNKNTTHFAEDDRMVFRAYAIPAAAQTMGGGRTLTLGYDGPNGATGTSFMDLNSPPAFKAETDPGVTPVPSGQTTMGIGNGQ